MAIILETPRLLFRDHLAEDLEPYCEMESDPVYRVPQPVHPRAELERSFREAVSLPKAMGLWATVCKLDQRYIGRCGLYTHRSDDGVIIPNEAVLAFYLARPYWGRGLASEAGRALVAYGFDALGLTRIVAGASVENIASNRALENSGLIYTHSGGAPGHRWHEYELRRPNPPQE